MLESLARYKHYNLLGPFISHEETKYSRGRIHNTSFSLILTNGHNELVLH
jgi:predicted nucleotidyltransferase